MVLPEVQWMAESTVFYIARLCGKPVEKAVLNSYTTSLVVDDICNAENNQPDPNSTGTRSGRNCYYNNLNSGYQFE